MNFSVSVVKKRTTFLLLVRSSSFYVLEICEGSALLQRTVVYSQCMFHAIQDK